MSEIILNAEQAEIEYNTVVAPALALISEACKERGFSFLALVDLPQAESTAVTSVTGSEQVGAMFFLAQAATKAEGSFDKLVSLMHEIKPQHSSIALHLLGVGGHTDENLLTDQLPLLYNLAVRANWHAAAVWLFNRMVESNNARNPDFDQDTA